MLVLFASETRVCCKFAQVSYKPSKYSPVIDYLFTSLVLPTVYSVIYSRNLNNARKVYATAHKHLQELVLWTRFPIRHPKIRQAAKWDSKIFIYFFFFLEITWSIRGSIQLPHRVHQKMWQMVRLAWIILRPTGNFQHCVKPDWRVAETNRTSRGS